MNKNWFYVSIPSCIGALIWSIVIFAITLFVPFAVSGELVFTYQLLPVIGDGTIYNYFAVIAKDGIGVLLGEGLMVPTYFILSYSLLIFYCTLLLDVLFAIFLMIFRNRYLRIVFRTISIILAVLIIFTFIAWLFYMVGVAGLIFGGADINLAITNSGLIFAFGFALLNGIFIERQFKFFAKPYKLTKQQYKDLEQIFYDKKLPEDKKELDKKEDKKEDKEKDKLDNKKADKKEDKKDKEKPTEKPKDKKQELKEDKPKKEDKKVKEKKDKKEDKKGKDKVDDKIDISKI
ncbi:MAG: hypothetical protein IKW33_03385 [Clostridia bacterium]|nr:hypothetical protein [Clostridia bacterium]